MQTAQQQKQISNFKYYSVEEKPNLLLAKGMLSINEYGLLYSLGKSYRSEGLVLDLGSFCGASAFCLGMGIIDSNVALKFNKPLHCFDLFINNNPNINNYINRFFYSHLKAGAQKLTSSDFKIKSFRKIFDFQTSYVKQYIQVHEGSLLELDLHLFDSSIEIINVDIGKTEALNNFIIKNFYNKIVPQGYIFQQDIVIPDHWYLLYSMLLLKDYLTLEFYKRPSGWLFQVRETIPLTQTDKCIQDLNEIDEESILESYQQCLSWIPDELHYVVNQCFAFCIIEKCGIGKFRDINAIFDHFNILIDSESAKRIKLLCLRKNYLTK